MVSKSPKQKGQKLKSALRDNLKKRKIQMRRLKGSQGEKGETDMKLRARAITSDQH